MRIAETLIIGIGTSGQNICEKVANNLSYKYGDYKKASWVGIKVLETAHKSDVLDEDDFIGMSVEQEAFADYISGAPHVGSDFDWNKWGDPNLLKNVGTCINKGAGNIRMAGRLALFHNYNLISGKITAEIHRLQKLSPAEIQKNLGTDDYIMMEYYVNVYVVGSLCGGTGSGCCADIGYLLRIWSNNNVNTTAIFTLPHWSLQSPRLKKNAFVALTELNHYMLPDSIWEQKLPGCSSPATDGRRPYEVTYLTMPSISEINKNESTIASFLTAVCTETSHDIIAANVNGMSVLWGDKQLGYLSPSFSTFGIASLEYTCENIAKMKKNRFLDKISSDISMISSESEPSIRVYDSPIPEKFQNDPSFVDINVCKGIYAFCSQQESSFIKNIKKEKSIFEKSFFEDSTFEDSTELIGSQQESSLIKKEYIQDIMEQLSNIVPLRKPVFDIRETNKDLYKIMYLQMEQVFSLAHIEGIMKRDNSDDQALEDSLSCNDYSYWNTRKDVKWTNCLITKELINRIRQYWFVYRFIGNYRDANGNYLICDRDGKISPWYKISQGKVIVEILSDNVVVKTEQIPLDLNDAVMDITSNSSRENIIKSICQNKIKNYCEQVGKHRFIEILFECLESFNLYELNISKEEAENCIINYCFNNGLMKEFINFKFPEDMPVDTEQFSQLYQLDGAQGAGYYCPNGHLLGTTEDIRSTLGNMIANRFVCPYCDKRYWPY